MAVTTERRYNVSIDPYDGGAIFTFHVSARNEREARRKARKLAEMDGWMRAAWRGVTCERGDA